MSRAPRNCKSFQNRSRPLPADAQNNAVVKPRPVNNSIRRIPARAVQVDRLAIKIDHLGVDSRGDDDFIAGGGGAINRVLNSGNIGGNIDDDREGARG